MDISGGLPSSAYAFGLSQRQDFPWTISENLKHGDIQALPSDLLDEISRGEILAIPIGQHYGTGRGVMLEGVVEEIEGIWDLPMVGGEQLEVAQRFQAATGGPEVTLLGLGGALVERDGLVCELQEHSERAGRGFEPAELMKRFEDSTTPRSFDKNCAEATRDYNENALENFRDRLKNLSDPQNYHPAGGLPRDAVLVVRTSALREFEGAVLEQAAPKDKPFGRREETTYLNIIGGLLALLLGKSPAGKDQSVFRNQSSVIEALLVNHPDRAGISARTLQHKLAAAKRSLES